MSITLHTSRQSAGQNPAREAVIEKIVQTYKRASFFDRAKILVVTPRQDTFQVERELIEKMGDGGLLGLRVIDYAQLLHELVDEGLAGWEVVDEHGRLMLMQKTLSDIRDDLTIYKGSAGKRGFAEQVVSQISDLKRAGITPEILSARAEELQESLLGEKLHDLSVIYTAFSKNLGPDRLDEDDFRVFALSLIPGSQFLNGSHLFFLDYSDIDYDMIQFLTRASEVAAGIDIALLADQTPTIKDMTTFAAANTSVNTLYKTARESQVDVEIKTYPTTHAGALGHLAGELFSYAPVPYTGLPKEIALYSLRDPWEEIIRAAQLILLENTAGRGFEKIALVTTDLNTYAGSIKRIFSEYGIPIFIDDNRAVIDNHFIQSIIFALDAVESGYRQADILLYIKSDYAGMTADEADLLENYVIEAGIKPWEWKKSFTRIPPNWKKYKKQKTLGAEDPINRLRERVYSALSTLKPENEAPFSVYIDALLSFLDRQNAQEILEETSEKVANQESQEIALRYRQIWNILIEVLGQMRETLGDDTTQFSDFVEVLKTGLASYEVGVIPEDKEAVIIASLERTKLPETESVYFVGLNEGLLPKSIYEESLLSEYDLERIGDAFNKNAESRGREYEHRLEELNFYSLLTKARERVTFSYSNFDSEGTPLLPSRYVEILHTLFGEKIQKKTPKVFNLLTPERADVLLESLDPEQLEIRYAKRAVNEWFTRQGEERSSHFTLPKVQEDTLRVHDVRELYAPDGTIRVSPSRLEEFANCPYQHFINYGLRPVEREEYEVQGLHTGILVHSVFERFLSELKRECEDNAAYLKRVSEYVKSPAKLEEDAEKVFEQVYSELEEAGRFEQSASNRYLLVKIKRIIYTALYIMLEQIEKSEYVPAFFEKPFYDQISEDLLVEGRIDRIDLPADGSNSSLRIVDYKTGNREITFTDLFYGRALQLALYLNEAVKQFDSATRKTIKDDVLRKRVCVNGLTAGERRPFPAGSEATCLSGARKKQRTREVLNIGCCRG